MPAHPRKQCPHALQFVATNTHPQPGGAGVNAQQPKLLGTHGSADSGWNHNCRHTAPTAIKYGKSLQLVVGQLANCVGCTLRPLNEKAVDILSMGFNVVIL